MVMIDVCAVCKSGGGADNNDCSRVLNAMMATVSVVEAKKN